MFLKKLKMELPYSPAIPLLGIYLEKTLNQKDTCTPMFTAALFTIAKTWKPPKCPSIDEWIMKILYMCVCVCVYNGILLSHKKNEMLPIAATWMDLILNEVSQRKTNII